MLKMSELLANKPKSSSSWCTLSESIECKYGEKIYCSNGGQLNCPML